MPHSDPHTPSSLWYNKFLSTRCIPPALRIESETSTDCYALILKTADFTQIKPGKKFKIFLCFFDTKFKHFFGRKFASKICRSNDKNSILIQDEVFFHSPIKEESIVIVVEIVEVDDRGEEWVLAWTVVPIFTKSETMSDYSSNVSVPVQSKRYQLYSGTAKLLFFVSSLESTKLTKFQAVLDCCLQTNENLKSALNYIPEYVIINKNDHVAGLRKPTEEMPMLACPEESDHFVGVLDNLTVSFGILPEQIESVFLDTLNKERNYRLNKGPEDTSLPKLEILERRLRIGIHNGYTFIEEPMVMYLSSKDEMDSGQHSLRKRSRSMSRLSNFIKSEYGTLQVRNNVKLTKLLADEEAAIVFSIDYLVGAKYSAESVADSKLIMVCWGAWSPFTDNAFTISDTITVPLVGGPRPNPDDVLCFKNLLRLRQKESDPFSDGKPRINLTFNFAMIGSTDAQVLLKIPQRSHSTLMPSGGRTRDSTPLPKPDFPVRPALGVFEDVPMQVEEKSKNVKNPEVRDTVESDYEPVELAPSFTNRSARKKMEYPEFELSGTDLTANVDSHLNKPSAWSRAASVAFTRVQFPQILDRNNQQPSTVDPVEKKRVLLEAEISAKLDTSEVILQFCGILNVKNTFLTRNPRVEKYFFTVKFYRFHSVTTERLIAHPGSEWKSNKPIPLTRLDENDKTLDKEGNGFMIIYTVDKSSLTQKESDFAEYLESGSVFIDVWNADSMAHVGLCQIPLQFLLRQGSSGVQATVQCPVIQSGMPQTETVTALLYLKMANIGHPSGFQTDVMESNNRAIVSRRLYRLGQEEFSSYKIRAKPLAAIHDSALQRFLTAQKLDINQRKEELFSSQNVNRIKKWEDLKKDNGEDITKASVKRFVFEEQLEAYKLVRNESRASKLLKAVFSYITIPHYIQKNAGKNEFFEFCLQNTFAEKIKCQIDISDDMLSVITNTDEWRHFKSINNIKTPLENDLFDIQKNDNGTSAIFVHLTAMESVYLPFKIQDSSTDEEYENVHQLKVIFKRQDTGEPLSILDLTVEVRNPIINAQFRWFSEELSKITKLITIPNHGKRVGSATTPDQTTLLQLRNAPSGVQELAITAHALTTPGVKSMLIFLYSDRYKSILLSTWKIHIHATQKLVIEGIQVQTTKVHFPMKCPEQTDMLIQYHSTSEALNIFPHQSFVSNPKALSEVQGYFTPNFAGKRIILVTAVNVNARELLCSWMIHATAALPNVVKTYEINLPLGGAGVTKKKITLENQYSVERNYRVHTSNPAIVSVDKEYFILKPKETTTVTLLFHPVEAEHGFSIDVYAFVEDAEQAQQEEAYLLKILYEH